MAFTGSIGNLEGIETPFAPAGGVLKTVADHEAMASVPVGWHEDGSQTLLGRLGNAIDPEDPDAETQRIVYYHNATTGETANALGMPGKPADVWVAEIPEKVGIAHAARRPYIQNVAPVSDEPLSELVEMYRRSYDAGADLVLLNAGCPNVVTQDGGRHEILSRSPDAFEAVLLGLQPHVLKTGKPIAVRLSPQNTVRDMRRIMHPIRALGIVSTVFVPNTWPNFVPLSDTGEAVLQVPGGAGGKSGPATADAAYEQTVWASALLEGTKVDVVSSGGIMHGTELGRRLGVGAVAGAGTTFFYESADWQRDTDRLLHQLATAISE